MAINDMILPGVKNPLLAVAEEIRKQISTKAMEQPKTSPPAAGMPQDRDYTEGMERPELTTLKGEREFRATPSRTSAFLVALGNILQDKQNLEAAKQQMAQGEYNAKLSDAMELNKLFKTGKIKREFDESDPDTQLRREMLQLDLAQKKEMYPLEKQYKQTALDRLLAKGTGGGGRVSGGGGGVSAEPNFANLSDEEVAQMTKWNPSQMKIFKAAPPKEKLRMLKPHMNEAAAAKLYSGGGYWDLSGEKPVYVKGEKEQSARDLELARKINRQKLGDYELMEPTEMTPEQVSEYEQLKADQQMIDKAIYNKVMQSVKGEKAPSNAPTAATKKSAKERAAELAAEGKSRKEAEAILMQEGY